MSIGEVIEINSSYTKDNTTGKKVIRLTDNKGDTVRPYFTQPLMSPDSNKLLVTSNRTGNWQLYLLNIKEKKLVQLTADNNISALTPCLDGKKMTAYYWNGNVLKSVTVDNFKNREIYKVPEGFSPSILSLSGEGRYLDFAYSEDLNLSTVSNRIYSGMNETFFRRPTSVIMRVDTTNNNVEAIWGERKWISHVNTSPVDNDMIVFCHEGPWHLVQRMWVVKASTHEVWPLIEQERHLERSGHEFFTDKGRIVTQYGVRETPSVSWNNSDIFIRPDGSEKEKYDYPHQKPMHVQVNSDETLGVGDAAFIKPDFEKADQFMSLIKYEDGKAEQELLCEHNTSWKTQTSHPHPIFTPDDAKVIFNSDQEGKVNVYMVEV